MQSNSNPEISEGINIKTKLKALTTAETLKTAYLKHITKDYIVFGYSFVVENKCLCEAEWFTVEELANLNIQMKFFFLLGSE